MRLGVFSVLDKAVGAFMQPFYARSKGEAIRSFSDAVNDPKSQFSRHGEDYVLMFHGEFDDGAGTFSCGEPQRVISALECVNPDIVAPDLAKVVSRSEREGRDD